MRSKCQIMYSYQSKYVKYIMLSNYFLSDKTVLGLCKLWFRWYICFIYSTVYIYKTHNKCSNAKILYAIQCKKKFNLWKYCWILILMEHSKCSMPNNLYFMKCILQVVIVSVRSQIFKSTFEFSTGYFT